MIKGSIVALVTPMSEDLGVDLDALEKLVDWHLDTGTSGLVIAGTTGEAATLSGGEFDTLLGTVITRVSGRIPVIAGTGSPDTEKTTNQTRRAETLGADAVLVVTPYYNRPPQTGMLKHFQSVANATSLPVILYNVPSRTSVDLRPETVAELARTENIVAIKEASTEPGRMEELVRIAEGRITVLSGDDPSCLQSMLLGAEGVISVAANVAPSGMAELCDLVRDSENDAAKRLNDRLQVVYAALALQTNPIPVKCALSEMGMIKNCIRLPLTTLADEYRLELAAALKAIDLID